MKTLSQVLFIANQPRNDAGSPVPIPAMYTREQFRVAAVGIAAVALFIGVVLGYGWHFESTRHHERTIAANGRRG